MHVRKGNRSKRAKNPLEGQLKPGERQLRLPIPAGKQLPLPIEEASQAAINPPKPTNLGGTSRDCPYARAGNPAKSADNPPAASYDNNPRSVV